VVDFTVDVTTPQAFAMLANLGLFPYLPCNYWYATANTTWYSPTEPLGLFAMNPAEHPTDLDNATSVITAGYAPGLGPGAPKDWVTRLGASSHVDVVQDGAYYGPFTCPLNVAKSPSAARFLGTVAPQAPLTYLQVTFAASVSYDDAVMAALDQGLRLARPCAEAKHAPWSPLSQESAYASGHTLTLALTFASSTLWQQQLHSLSGVVSFQSPYMPAC
jgi:hypothetical protein